MAGTKRSITLVTVAMAGCMLLLAPQTSFASVTLPEETTELRRVRLCRTSVSMCRLTVRTDHAPVEAADYAVATSYVSAGTLVIGGLHTAEYFCYAAGPLGLSECD